MPVLLDPCTSANLMTDLPIRNHVSSIFNPILGQIRGLIGKQVQEIRRKEGKPPKVIALLFTTPAALKTFQCIMLVGGFGRCSYLFQVVRKEFASQETEILQSSGNEPYVAPLLDKDFYRRAYT